MLPGKGTVIVDDELIAQAGTVLGTCGINETIDAALRSVLVQEARRSVIEQLRTMDGLDLNDPGVMALAWGD